jgi:outer membrane immunogenic protein
MKNSRAALIALSALSALATTDAATAADMRVKAQSAASSAYSWTGFYAGNNAGVAWGTFDPSTTAPLNPATGLLAANAAAVTAAGATLGIKPSSFTGGFEAGYNWQTSNTVLGLEGDIESFNLKGNSSFAGTFPGGVVGFGLTSSASTTWLATARGRVGIATNNWLVYATGGAAFITNKPNGILYAGVTSNLPRRHLRAP